MSQHDFNIANQTFPSFRSDLNDALQAAATISAGATAPTTPYAYQLWYDTANEKYMIRNAANSAWLNFVGIDTNGNVDVTGTVTADGLTVDGNGELTGASPKITWRADAGNDYAIFTDSASTFNIRNASTATNHFTLSSGGDISFYEDTGTTAKFFWDASAESLGIVNTTPANFSAAANDLVIGNTTGSHGITIQSQNSSNGNIYFTDTTGSSYNGFVRYYHGDNALGFGTNDGTERLRIISNGSVLIGTETDGTTADGFVARQSAETLITRTNNHPLLLNRAGTDGAILLFRAQNVLEGYINVSGTTVSLVGGHLSRLSRLTNDSKDTSIVKGTVMTNLDEMVEWSHETTYWTDEDELPVDEDGNPTVSVGDVKTAAYIEDNEQLNKMAVSSVEGDANVAGVFVNWDNDDDWNDMNVAMTGDMVIRIAQGTTVARGDLLMSAGDGTAKPQGDDIVRSKTIAKVTSTHVSHTYEDGSYLVPCVLMAC